jgi:hypothetical protein
LGLINRAELARFIYSSFEEHFTFLLRINAMLRTFSPEPVVENQRGLVPSIDTASKSCPTLTDVAKLRTEQLPFIVTDS